MFVTSNQIYVFIACVFLGVYFGIPFSVIRGINFLLKNKVLENALYAVYFLNLGLLYVYFGFTLSFPSLRIFMPIGVLLGLFAYIKSFHLILAKYGEKLYNKYKEKRIKSKDERK